MQVDRDSHWMRPINAAQYLGVRVGTLARWRLEGRGPEYSRAGRLIRYFRPALDNWLQSRSAGGDSSSETQQAPSRRGSDSQTCGGGGGLLRS